jgi:hypothetical protein
MEDHCIQSIYLNTQTLRCSAGARLYIHIYIHAIYNTLYLNTQYIYIYTVYLCTQTLRSTTGARQAGNGNKIWSRPSQHLEKVHDIYIYIYICIYIHIYIYIYIYIYTKS